MTLYKFMRTTVSVATGMVILSNIVACSSSPSTASLAKTKDAALGRASVVSMGSLNLDPHKPSTISWLSPVDVVGGQDDTQIAMLTSITQLAIQNQIGRKGYPLLNAGGDYQMRVFLILGRNQQTDSRILTSQQDLPLARSELLQKIGIDPGLVGDQLSDTGSLIIELRQGRAMRWRGAVQIYLLSESDSQIAADRIERAVQQLLFTWRNQ